MTIESSGTASTQASTRGPTSVGTPVPEHGDGRPSPRSGSSTRVPLAGPTPSRPATSRLARIGPVSTRTAASQDARQVRLEAVLDHQPVELEPGDEPDARPAAATSGRLPSAIRSNCPRQRPPSADRRPGGPAERAEDEPEEPPETREPFGHHLAMISPRPRRPSD